MVRNSPKPVKKTPKQFLKVKSLPLEKRIAPFECPPCERGA